MDHPIREPRPLTEAQEFALYYADRADITQLEIQAAELSVDFKEVLAVAAIKVGAFDYDLGDVVTLKNDHIIFSQYVDDLRSAVRDALVNL